MLRLMPRESAINWAPRALEMLSVMRYRFPGLSPPEELSKIEDLWNRVRSGAWHLRFRQRDGEVVSGVFHDLGVRARACQGTTYVLPWDIVLLTLGDIAYVGECSLVEPPTPDRVEGAIANAEKSFARFLDLRYDIIYRLSKNIV